MNTTDHVAALLDEKRELFHAYEEATLALLESDADSAEHYIIERSRLANEIDILTEKIGKLCDETPGGDILFEAAKASIEYTRVPAEMRPVYELGQQIRSYGARIAETEKQVLEHLKSIQDAAMAKIKENQHMPKIKKYFEGLDGGPSGGALGGGKA